MEKEHDGNTKSVINKINYKLSGVHGKCCRAVNHDMNVDKMGKLLITQLPILKKTTATTKPTPQSNQSSIFGSSFAEISV